MLNRMLLRYAVAPALCLSLFIGTSTPAHAGYVVASTDDQAIVFLDDSFNEVRRFQVPLTDPNGIATDGSTIWVGSPTDDMVRAYDFAGNFLFEWGMPGGFPALQAMELVNGEIAIQDGPAIEYYDPITGAGQGSIPSPGSTVEGLAFDGSILWALNVNKIVGLNPADGAVVSMIANAAAACPFGGAGLTSIGGGLLAIGCTTGDWFVVHSSDGSLVDSGNNGIGMFGIKHFNDVPEPSTMALAAAGLLAVGLIRRRRG